MSPRIRFQLRDGVRFDLTKMSWIGKASSDPKVFVVGTNSDVKTFEDLRDLKETKNMAEGGVGSGTGCATRQQAASASDSRSRGPATQADTSSARGQSGSKRAVKCRSDRPTGIPRRRDEDPLGAAEAMMRSATGAIRPGRAEHVDR